MPRMERVPATKAERRRAKFLGSSAPLPRGSPEVSAPLFCNFGSKPTCRFCSPSSYKTPKRTLVSKSRLPTFSSPGNEADLQQEIFWDPNSPTACKLGNYQKKQTVSGHMVEISEIVNRIAPQDEKPACNENSLLGLWIGDDAIPCTPGITTTCTVCWRKKILTAYID
uniref:Uncharacterized protein n=1 Tax=Salvator merianae TaxID=96440 RepID=A0A8D0BXM1_SALMN